MKIHSLIQQRFANSERTLLKRALFVGYVGIAVSTVSCGGGSDTPSVGSCDVRADEPVLTLRTAASSANNFAINEVRLADIKFNGISVDTAAIIASSKNVRRESDVLICTLPCAFGSDDYRITMVASAPGFQSKSITVDASYASKIPGCPSLLTNGTKIDILLSPL